ncbi:retention module-containing protein, partial [Shewanella waksmanii]|uniref:retention module-containing protein n=1 Tax=Shewanella waksmanii TaxID=213783 RepID=UPI003736F526
MGILTIEKQGQVTLVNGSATISINGQQQPVEQGDVLIPGTVVEFTNGSQLEITYDDGSIFSSNNIASSTTSSEIPEDLAALDEIEQLQALIASGEDPTAELPDTAAGGATGNEGGSDFVSLSRDGSETIAAAQYDTSFDAATPTAALSIAPAPLDTVGYNIAQFTDSFVNGVAYTTSSGLSGFTGDLGPAGSFAYNAGDTITFSVGGVTIAEFSADIIQGSILFLQDIAGTELSDSNLNYVENMAIFLQALDSDLSDGVDDGVLQTNSLINADTAFANNITILSAIHDALANYVDPTTGQPLNLATAGKEMLSLVLNELGIIFTRESERSETGENIFETLAMQHVADTIDALAGDRAPGEHDDRLADIIEVPGGLITYNYNELDGKITFSANDLLVGAVGHQVITENLVVKNVQLSAEFADIGTLVDLGDGNYEIILNEGVDQYDLENLSIDYRVEDWTAFREVTSSTQDQYKSHLSADIPDVLEDVGFNQFALNSQLVFDEDQQLFINFTSELLSEQLGFPIAEYADDYIVPLEYSNDGGLTWQTMTVESIDYSGTIPRPIFGFTLAAGNDAVLIRVPIFDDAQVEPTEYFRADVTGENFYDEVLQFAIFDNDGGSGNTLPTIDIDYAIAIEGMEFATFTLTLSSPSTEVVTVDFSSEELTALFGEDFINVSGTVTFQPGETVAYINVPIVDDLIVETDNPEFALINLSNPTNALLTDPQGTLRIFDNDLPANTAISIDLDPVTGDNVITTEEGEQLITITGTVTADASIGVGIVIVTINGQNYQTVMDANGNFSIQVQGSELFLDSDTVVDAVVYGYGLGDIFGTATTTEDYDLASVLIDDVNVISEDSIASGNVLENDSDGDDVLTVATFEVNGEQYNAGDTVVLDGGSLVINKDGSYTFTPNENWNGTVPVITYTTNTGYSSTLSIVVTPVDDESVLVNDAQIIDEDTIATGNVLSNDTDVDNVLTVAGYEVDGQGYPAGATAQLDGGTLVINEDGSYTFTPNENWNGVLPVITYTTNTGSTATLTIEVAPVDDPSILENDTNTVEEDTVATGNVLENDFDVDDELTVASFEIDGETYDAGTLVTLESGVIVINTDGSYTFTPAENWNGILPVITYTTNTGSTATLTLEVTPVDDESQLLNDFNTINEGSIATGNVLNNDTDIDNILSVTTFSLNGQTYNAGTSVTLTSGILVIESNGSYTFVPNENWNGVLPTITYVTNTGSSATLNINVLPVDDPTITVNDTNTIQEDTFASGNVLANDSDLDSVLSIASFSVEGSSYTANSTVVLNSGTLTLNSNGNYTFTPTADWNGTVPVITYVTNTGVTATLTIIVQPENDAPLAEDDSFSVDEGAMVSGNVITHDDGDGVVDSDGG